MRSPAPLCGRRGVRSSVNVGAYVMSSLLNPWSVSIARTPAFLACSSPKSTVEFNDPNQQNPRIPRHCLGQPPAARVEWVSKPRWGNRRDCCLMFQHTCQQTFPVEPGVSILCSRRFEEGLFWLCCHATWPHGRWDVGARRGKARP